MLPWGVVDVYKYIFLMKEKHTKASRKLIYQVDGI